MDICLLGEAYPYQRSCWPCEKNGFENVSKISVRIVIRSTVKYCHDNTFVKKSVYGKSFTNSVIMCCQLVRDNLFLLLQTNGLSVNVLMTCTRLPFFCHVY